MSIIKNTEELNNLLDAVQKLPVKKDEQEKVVDITENGTTVVTPDEGMTLGGVTVNVEVESSGTNANGIFFIEFDSKYGLPQTIDIRNMGYDYDNSKARGALHYFFANYSTATGNGFYTELKTVYLPDWIAVIGISMFNCCRSLENIYGDFSNVTIIDGGAFGQCKSLKTIPYMPKLQKIEGNAFNGCIALTEIKLPDTITSLKSNAFNGCTALTDIYVGFAEGAVANAPWGAANATIHYNTIYDENGNPIEAEV